MSEVDHTSTNGIVTVKDNTMNNIIAKNYSRKSKEYPFGSKLSSIREEMKEFCDSMDRFIEENKVVFKNGEVEGFWSQKTTDANSQTDSVNLVECETRETEAKGSVSDEDKLQWWSSKERRLKVQEIIKKRENEAQKDQAEDVKTSDNFDRSKQEDEKPRTDNFQDVYDLMTLKTCPKVFSESRETYAVKSENNLECERSEKVQEKSCKVFGSLFAELRSRDSDCRKCKLNVSNELMAVEGTSSSQTSAIDAERKYIYNIIHTTTPMNVDSDEQSSNRESTERGDGNFDAKIDILEDKFDILSFESPKEKKNMDESDDESFKTATSLPEDTQVVESDQGSLESFRSPKIEKNNDNIVDIIKQSVDNSVDDRYKEIVSHKESDNVICEDKKNDKTERSLDSNNERVLSTEITKVHNSQVELVAGKMNRLSLQRTSQSLTGKRTREAEDIQVSTKKSLLVEEVDLDRKSEERKTRSQISERCKQHAMQEARKFVKKASPLIDKCITTLIKDAENAGEKSHYYYNKYDRKSLAESLTFVPTAKSDLNKIVSDSKEQNNCDKDEDESKDLSNAYSARYESMSKRTINSESIATVDDTGRHINIQ